MTALPATTFNVFTNLAWDHYSDVWLTSAVQHVLCAIGAMLTDVEKLGLLS